MENLIVIKSVFRKVGQNYTIQPCRNPKTGRYPECVRRISGDGDMILSASDVEKLNSGECHFVPEDQFFTLVDGTTFNLNDVVESANWEAIKYCPIIAKDRDERDENNVLVIDGDARKYGKCELYVERPGSMSSRKNSYKQKKNIAESYIFNDTMEDRLAKCRVLGRNMRQRPDADVIDFLLTEADKTPDRIIDLYTGEDFQIRLQISEAVEKNIIIKRSNIYYYNEIPLGMSDDACLVWFKDPRNRKVTEMIRTEIYPELAKKNTSSDETPAKKSTK